MGRYARGGDSDQSDERGDDHRPGRGRPTAACRLDRHQHASDPGRVARHPELGGAPRGHREQGAGRRRAHSALQPQLVGPARRRWRKVMTISSPSPAETRSRARPTLAGMMWMGAPPDRRSIRPAAPSTPKTPTRMRAPATGNRRDRFVGTTRFGSARTARMTRRLSSALTLSPRPPKGSIMAPPRPARRARSAACAARGASGP